MLLGMVESLTPRDSSLSTSAEYSARSCAEDVPRRSTALICVFGMVASGSPAGARGTPWSRPWSTGGLKSAKGSGDWVCRTASSIRSAPLATRVLGYQVDHFVEGRTLHTRV